MIIVLNKCFYYICIFYKYGIVIVCYLFCYKNIWYCFGILGNDRNYLLVGNIVVGYRKG